MNRNNSCLLTGASGFLGNIIKNVLTESGYFVNGLDLRDQDFNKDITKPFLFENELRADIVIHAAGKAHSIPQTPEEEKSFFDVNFDGTKNLCNALMDISYKPKSFIFISTVAVYGVNSGHLISENHPLNGVTPYAKSKILAENWLLEWAAKNNIKLGIVRLPLIAGPNPPGNLGDMIRGIKNNRYLSIGNASARKSIVWQTDIAKIIPILSEVGGIYNLTDGYHPCFKELEAAISKALGRNKPKNIPMFVAKMLGVIGDLVGPSFPINSGKLTKITSTLTFDDTMARNMLNWLPVRVLDKISEELTPNN